MNVRHALDSYPCLQLVPAEPRLGGPGLTGPADAQAMAAAMLPFVGPAAGGAAETAAAAPSNGSAASGEAAACKEPAAAEAADAGSWSSSSVAQGCSQQQWLSPAEAAMVQRFDPAGQADTIGFFVAKFVKTCSCL